MLCNCENPFYGLPLQNSNCNAVSSVFFMSLVNSIIRKRCEISDICGRIKPITKPDDEYDFIVAGGGGGGAVVAGRLSENPNWKVLLIEAGDDEPVGSQVPSFAYDFLGPKENTITYKSDPQTTACLENTNKQCSWSRVKILGGCGVVNGMLYMRGVPKDYDNWNKIGNTGWSYKDILPYFKKSEDNGNIGVYTSSVYHGVGGPIRVERFPDQPPIAYDILQAARTMGYATPSDLNGNVFEGFAISQMMSRNGVRDSTARAYLRTARHRSNLHIMLNSTATKINFNRKNTSLTAKSIEMNYAGQNFTVKIKKEVILAGGVFGSPQLLLLSGVGPKDDLDKVQVPFLYDLPGVGKNLLNHVAINIQFNLKNQNNTNLLNWENLQKFIHHRKGPLSYLGLSMIGSRLSSSKNSDKNWPDLQFGFNSYMANCTYGSGIGNLAADPKEPNNTRRLQIQVTLNHPRSKGFLKLKSNDPFDLPIITPNFFDAETDITKLTSGIRLAMKLGNADNLKRKYDIEFIRGEYGNCSKLHTFDSDEYWKCALQYDTYPTSHLAGTCKMGPKSDEFAVVNTELKVYGTTNVRVGDASAFPTLTSGNLLATIVVFSERAADFIKQDWS